MKLAVDLDSLTVDERLELIEQIWESLRKKPEQIRLTRAQEEELDRRIDDFEQNPGGGIPWEQVVDRIRAKK